MNGEFGIALATYHEAERIRRLLLGDNHLDVGAMVYNEGQAHHQLGELQKFKRHWIATGSSSELRPYISETNIATLPSC
jgi:hypothetical protein